MTNWKITGIVATLVIILAVPAYLVKQTYVRQPVAMKPEAGFVGGQKCAECHKAEYDKWQGSHHDLAMDVAGEQSVLGNFNDSQFQYFNETSRFYRRDGRYWVHTRGPGGELGDFEIKYTFGAYPLQQYLVAFSGGRLQCLPIAWDVRENKWFHLYPDAPIDPGDWLYWTNAGQNWNGMCAECHSTNLKKNYDPKTDAYQTTWSEIDVSCEACHGPGSLHVAWAELPEMARPAAENYRLVVKTSGINSRDQVELCAPCHSRRAILGDYTHAEPDLMDSMLPSLLNQGLYFADGQILEEVYVYGSFTQSKMYGREVRCSDCHDVHSIKTVKSGNTLCLQCHRAGVYDTKAHHFHKKEGEDGRPIMAADGKVLFEVGTGAQCVQCHMPGRMYMVNDYRPDHSFRIPRPDLSMGLGAPNACNRCHIDKSDQWSNEYMTKWYGPGQRAHYGTIIDAGRKRLPEAADRLIRLAGDPLYPVIVRATALSLLGSYPASVSTAAYERALMDSEALIRRTAVDNLKAPDLKRQITLLTSALYDPVKAVRMEAARRMSEIAAPELDNLQENVYQKALAEFQQSMEYSADFAFGRYNLGNLFVNLKQPDKAIENFRAATRIDSQFYPAQVNLAMLYNQMGRKDEAEALLREVATAHDDLHQIQYSLGLLLAENQKLVEAAFYLQKAAAGLPEAPRVHYNLGLLLQQLKRDAEAEVALKTALRADPGNLDFLYALADYYLKRRKFAQARQMAEQMMVRHPNNAIGSQILKYIDQLTSGKN